MNARMIDTACRQRINRPGKRLSVTHVDLPMKKSSIVRLLAALIGCVLSVVSLHGYAEDIGCALHEDFSALQVNVNIGTLVIPPGLKNGEVIKSYPLSLPTNVPYITNRECNGTTMQAAARMNSAGSPGPLYPTNVQGISYRIETDTHTFPYDRFIPDMIARWEWLYLKDNLDGLKFVLVKTGDITPAPLTVGIYGEASILDQSRRVGTVVQINVSNGGTIRSAACTPSSRIKNVDFGNVSAVDLDEGKSANQRFSITLRCDKNVGLKVRTEADAEDADKGLIKTTGTAQGVVVELLQGSQAQPPPVKLNVEDEDAENQGQASFGTLTLRYQANLKKKAGAPVTAGTANAQATLTFIYY